MTPAQQRLGPAPDDPEAYVRNNRDRLLRVIRHCDNPFRRCRAIAALIEYGPDPSMEQVIEDIRRIEGRGQSQLTVDSPVSRTNSGSSSGSATSRSKSSTRSGWSWTSWRSSRRIVPWAFVVSRALARSRTCPPHMPVGSSRRQNELETVVQSPGEADRYHFTSYSPTMVQTVLQHAFTDVAWIYTARCAQPNERTSDLSALSDSAPLPDIDGMAATFSLGTFPVKGSPRTRDIISGSVHTPEDAVGAVEQSLGGGGGG